MNKTLVLFVAFLLVPSLVLSVVSEDSWYQESFNDSGNNINNLTVLSSVGIDTSIVKVGTNSFKCTSTGGSASDSDASNVPTGNKDRSICAWVYPTSNINDGGQHVMVQLAFTGTPYPSYSFWLAQVQGASGAIQIGTNGENIPARTQTITQNTWTHICWIYSSGTKNVSIFINDAFFSSGILANTPTVANPKVVLFNNQESNNGWTGYLDDVRIYNYTLSATNVSFIYNGGNGTALSLGASVAAGVSIPTFINQNPSDVTSTSIFNNPYLEIQYNASTTGWNGSTYLNFTIDMAGLGAQTIINGSITRDGYYSKLGTNTTKDYFNFSIDENEIYPVTGNLPVQTFNTIAHSSDTLATANDLAKITFLNFSTKTDFNYLEIMINRTGTGTSDIYYCNQSYSTSSPASSINCAIIGGISSATVYNHSNTQNSSHMLIGFGNVAGKIGGVQTTPNSSIIIRGANGGATLFYYLSSIIRPDATSTSGNNGNTWSNYAGIIDAHLHQFNGTMSIKYQDCSYNSTSWVCSIQRTDNLNITPSPPNPTSFITPVDGGNYTRYLNITWNIGTAQPPATLSIQNLSLYLNNGTFIAHISQMGGTNTSYYFDTYIKNLTPGIYYTQITGIDSNGRSTTGHSENFNILTNAEINITLKNAYSLVSVANFSGNISNNQTGYFTTYATGNYSVIAQIVKGYQNLYITAPGYSITSQNTKSIFSNLTFNQYNATLYSANSVLVNVYDQNTGTLITPTNITIIVSGNSSEVIYTTTLGSILIENLTDGAYTFKLSGGNYSLSTYPVTVASASTQTLNAYLTTSTDTTTLTIQDYDSSAIIEGATITMQRLINSTYATIESKLSDITGRGQFTYNIGVKYKFIVQATGYADKTFYLDPILSSTYTVRLTKTVTVTTAPDYTGVVININPTLFYATRENNLTFTISSPEGALISYYFNASWPGGNYTGSGSSAIGGTIGPIQFNISGVMDANSRVSLRYGYQSTVSTRKDYTAQYEIIGSSPGTYQNNTFISNKDRTYGLGIFERSVVATVGSIIVAGIFTMVAGVAFGASMGLLVLGYLVYIGFIPIWLVIISMIVGVFMIFKWGG